MKKQMIKGVNTITSLSGGTEAKETITILLSDESIKKFGKTIHPLNITWEELFQVKDVLSSMKEDDDLILIVEDEIFLEHDRSKKKLFLGLRRQKDDEANVIRFELTEDVLKQFNAVLEEIESEEIKAEVEEVAVKEGESGLANCFTSIFDRVNKAVTEVTAAETERIKEAKKKKEEEESKEDKKEDSSSTEEKEAKPTEEATLPSGTKVELPKDKTALRKAVIERETFKEAVARKQAEDKAKEAKTKPTTEGKEPEVVSSPTK